MPLRGARYTKAAEELEAALGEENFEATKAIDHCSEILGSRRNRNSAHLTGKLNGKFNDLLGMHHSAPVSA